MTHEKTATVPNLAEGVYHWTDGNRDRFYRRLRNGWETTKQDPRRELCTWTPSGTPDYENCKLTWWQRGEKPPKRKTRAEKDATPLFDAPELRP